jgi:hypothetical protein
MKKHLLIVFISAALLFSFNTAASSQGKTAHYGRWNFEAPSAPEGYSWGTMEFRKDTTLIEFSATGYFLPSNKPEITDDSVKFQIDVGGVLVYFMFRIENPDKITGRAVWSDGETQMILTRRKENQ